MASAGTFIEYAARLSREQRDLQRALGQPPFSELREGRVPAESTVPPEAVGGLQSALTRIFETFSEIEGDDQLWGVLGEIPRADELNPPHRETLNAVRTRIEGLAG